VVTRLLLEKQANGLVWTVDQHIQWANPAALELLGEPLEKILGRDIIEWAPPEQILELEDRRQARRRGEPVADRYELDLRRQDGKPLRVEVAVRNLDDHGTVFSLRPTPLQARDTALLTELSRLASQVQRHHEEAEVLEAAASGLQHLGIDLMVLRARPGGKASVIRLGRPTALEAVMSKALGRPLLGLEVLVAGFGVWEELRQGWRYLADLPRLVESYLLSQGLPVPPELARARSPRRGVVSMVTVRGGAWGLCCYQGDDLTRADAAALHLFTAQLASALENAELIGSLRRSNTHLEAVRVVAEAGRETDQPLLVQALLGVVAEALESERVALYEVEGPDLVMLGTNFLVERDALASKHTRIPLGAGPIPGDAIRSGRARAYPVDDFSEPARSEMKAGGVHHIAFFPLLLESKLSGLLNVGRHRPMPFTEDELRSGELIANQVAVQLEKGRMLQEKQRRVEELNLLLEVSRAITASLEPDRILEASAVGLAQMLSCDSAFIWLHDPHTGRLRGGAAANPAHREHFSKVSLSPEDPSAAAQAILQRAPVRVGTAAGSAMVNQPLLQRYQVKSLLALPLLLRDQAIGAISVGDTQHFHPWTDGEVERATLMAGQIAVAVSNARLFDDLKQSYSQLERAQKELVKSERLAALGELSAVVAHEVRNPLGVIFNSVSSLKKRLGPLTGESQLLLEMVGEEADRLNRIVSDLLDFARPHSPVLRSESVLACLQSARDAISAVAQSNVTLHIEEPPVPLLALVDARMLRQALFNLLVNALQAMPQGGRVTLRASQVVRGAKRWVRIQVQDTGVGFAADVAEQMFQPFFTTKATGTGLGLAVVKRIIDAHQGEVTVESTPGVGTTFSLWLREPDSV
jgi:PAS domain S-box-containing protein